MKVSATALVLMASVATVSGTSSKAEAEAQVIRIDSVSVKKRLVTAKGNSGGLPVALTCSLTLSSCKTPKPGTYRMAQMGGGPYMDCPNVRVYLPNEIGEYCFEATDCSVVKCIEAGSYPLHVPLVTSNLPDNIPEQCWAQQPRHQLRDRIPKADPAKYRDVRDARDWKNPYLVVGPAGVEIVGVTSRGSGIPIQSIGAALEALPGSAWPYGLVVAVQDGGALAPGDGPRVRANRDKLLRTLKQLGVAVDLWPSA